MCPCDEAAARILDIESRQDEVLKQLDELERRVAAVLAEYLPAGTPLAALLPQPTLAQHTVDAVV